MKTKTTLLFVSYVCLAFGQGPIYDHRDCSYSALPMMAAVCDLAGIGELASQTNESAIINIKQLWFGEAATNNVKLFLYDDTAIPAGGTNFVFFASQYAAGDCVLLGAGRYAHMFKMDQVRSSFIEKPMFLLMHHERALVPVVAENASLIDWSSNLVQTSQVSTNMQAFYELIRDGCRLNPPASRMHQDSDCAFMQCGYYMPKEFMRQILLDENLTSCAAQYVTQEYVRENGSLE
jgi:hypothetical protein